MLLTKYTFLKILLAIASLWFFYWGIYNEMVVYHKTINGAFVDSGQNIVLMIVCLVLLAYITRKETPQTQEPFQPDQRKVSPKKDDNPFLVSTKKVKKQKNKNAFKPYLSSQLEGISKGIDSAFESAGRTKIHLRWFLRIKRLYFGLLFFFYFLLTLTSFSNPALAFLFLSTAYLALDYLWKTRGYEWKKKGETNEE